MGTRRVDGAPGTRFVAEVCNGTAAQRCPVDHLCRIRSRLRPFRVRSLAVGGVDTDDACRGACRRVRARRSIPRYGRGSAPGSGGTTQRAVSYARIVRPLRTSRSARCRHSSWCCLIPAGWYFAVTSTSWRQPCE
jgi:hypothetical protein